MNLVLASQSPRRRELLTILGYPFTVVPSSIDETPNAGEDPEVFVARVAREKGITMQELLRAVVIPEWVRLSGASQKKHRNAKAETPV